MKSIEYYMDIPYTILLKPDGEGGWYTEVVELPHCTSGGDTKEEALQNIEEAKKIWIEMQLELNRPVPEPRRGGDFPH